MQSLGARPCKNGAARIRAFGFRVAEPHHDGTPHWHLLLFLRPEEVEFATAVFRKHALKEDGYEPGAQGTPLYRYTD